MYFSRSRLSRSVNCHPVAERLRVRSRGLTLLVVHISSFPSILLCVINAHESCQCDPSASSPLERHRRPRNSVAVAMTLHEVKD